MSEETAMQTVTQPADEGGGIMCWPRASTQYMTSLGNDEAGITARVAAMSGGMETLKEYVGRTIKVADWFIHTVDREDAKSGEVRQGPRLVLIMDDGSMVVTSSAVVASTIGHLCSLTGFTSFNPPREFVVGQGIGPNGKYLTITPVTKSTGKKK